jgi:hypothetical protein
MNVINRSVLKDLSATDVVAEPEICCPTPACSFSKRCLRNYMPQINWKAVGPKQLPASAILLLNFIYFLIGNKIYFNAYINKLFAVKSRIIIMILWPSTQTTVMLFA